MTSFLLKVGGNPARVFKFAEHAFDDMTLLPLASYPLSASSARAANVHHEGNRLGDVRCLTSRQHEAHGQAQCICQRVNLATKTATRASQRPSSCVARGRARSACAQTTVLSMQTFSKSALADTWAIVLSQTSNRLQTSKALENAIPMSGPVPWKSPLRAGAQNPQQSLDKAATSRFASRPDTGNFLQDRC